MTWLMSLLIASAVFSNASTPTIHVDHERVSQNFSQTDETERTEQTYPFSPNGTIEVGNINGSITIETWDKPQIRLETVKVADSKERLAELKINIDAQQDRFKLGVDYGAWKDRNKNDWNRNSKLVVNFNLTVPKTAKLDEIHTVNGSVSISNSTSYTKASAVNGSVKASNLGGNADLSTVNGAVEASYDSLKAGNIVELSTVNGSALLLIPSDSNATIRAESLNGKISTDFGLPVRKGKYVGRDLYGKLGNGDVKIKLESVNGELSVKRQSDGKTPNPATNLLPAKSDDEVDFDNDFDAALRLSRIDLLEAQRAVANARREMEKAVRTSGVEAEKAAIANLAAADAMKVTVEALKPEIAKINEEAMRSAMATIESLEGRERLEAARMRSTKAMIADQRFSWRTPFAEEKTGSFAVKGTPKISINASNCSISVRGWDRSEVKYSMTKIASNVAQRPVEFDSKQVDSGKIDIRIDNQNGNTEGVMGRDSVRVILEVFVPKKSDLKITTNGEIRVDGVSGDIVLKGENQAINVRDSNGMLNLNSEDGLVRVIGFKGELDANLQDGELFIEGDFQRINANSQDGSIVLSVPAETNANIISNSDAVECDGVAIIADNISGNKFNRWKMGKGGKDFVFNFADGNLTIRNIGDISARF